MKCLIRGCDEMPTVGRLCHNHFDWAYYELADDKYRDQEPPSPIGWQAKDRSAIQSHLLVYGVQGRE